MKQKIEIMEEQTTEEEKGSRLKHIIPLNPSVASSKDQEESSCLIDCVSDVDCIGTDY